MSEKKWAPKDVDDLNAAMGTNAMTLMPPREDIPKEFKSSGNAWNKFFGDIKIVDAVPMEGIDKKKALRHLATICKSFEPSHEHKEAAVAYLASLCSHPLNTKAMARPRRPIMSEGKQFKPLSEPSLIKAGDSRVLLGLARKPPLVDCRVVAEKKYQELLKVVNFHDQLVEALKKLDGAFRHYENFEGCTAAEQTALDESKVILESVGVGV